MGPLARALVSAGAARTLRQPARKPATVSSCDTIDGSGLTAIFELRLDEQSFTARVSDGDLELSRGAPESAEAIIASDPGTLTAVLWHGRRLTDALRAGEITVDGNRAAVGRFLKLFPAPTLR
jgi:alkyl sulfatase BDS1-like metallo-beta-lactamase superfamily hydrolase